MGRRISKHDSLGWMRNLGYRESRLAKMRRRMLRKRRDERGVGDNVREVDGVTLSDLRGQRAFEDLRTYLRIEPACTPVIIIVKVIAEIWTDRDRPISVETPSPDILTMTITVSFRTFSNALCRWS